MSLARPLLLLGLLLATPAVGQDAQGLLGQRVMDLDGNLHTLGGRAGEQPTVLVLIGTECPISNRSIPKLNLISGVASLHGAQMFAVVSDPWATRAAVRKHAREYNLRFPVLLDGGGHIAQALQPKRVPSAFLLDTAGKVRYRGAIDDAWAGVGKPRATTKHHYLLDAITAVGTGGKVTVPRTEAVGCAFEQTRPKNAPAATYNRDVAPILATHCVTCHRPNEVAPFSLTNYAQAARHAQQIVEVTEDKLMPPWKPVAGHGRFLDERRLSKAELATLKKWVAAGAPEGKAEDAAPAPKLPTGWKLGKPDLVLEQKEEFTVPADGDDVFRCFVIPTKFTRNRQIVGVEYKPGAASVVHHAILFLDNYKRGRKLEVRDAGPGYKSFGGIGFRPDGTIGGFAPGATPSFLPKGVARHVRKDADIILQLHYHPTGKVERDKGKIAIYFAKDDTNKRLDGLVLGTRNVDIPPGTEKYERKVHVTLPRPVTFYGTFPHMHYLGRTMKVWATLPDKRVVPLLRIDDWDFRWQNQYWYQKPIRLPAGTRLDLTASYDNSNRNPYNPSSPPKRVTYGDQSTDEMCFCFFAVTTDEPEHFNDVQAAIMQMFIAEERKRTDLDRNGAKRDESGQLAGPRKNKK